MLRSASRNAVVLLAAVLTMTAATTGIVTVANASPHGTKTPATEVTIKRDTFGTPHVYAGTTHGLFYGYGYAIAQDRLFQLEMAKRSFTGTVAEVLGSDWGAFDAGIRANRDPASLDRQYSSLPAADKLLFEGYADGVNAWIDQVKRRPESQLPKQFKDFGFEPAKWTPMDVVMIFVGSMANRFSDGNQEIQNLQLRTALLKKHGPQGMALFEQLRPQVANATAPNTIPSPEARSHDREPAAENAADRLVPATSVVSPQLQEAPRASNLWMFGKGRAKGADSILMNGPQFNWFNPAYTYSIGLHGAGFDVVGNTPFGYPAIIFGHNRDIAWGATAGMGDTVDMYQEKLNPVDEHQYFFKGRWRDMAHRSETVTVRDASPITVDVYSTGHGRVTAWDLPNSVAYSKKRSWEGHEIESLLGWLRAAQATNYARWRDQVSRMAISINMDYADRQGNIGHIFAGRFPIRPSLQNTRLPAVGTGEMEWLGMHPFRDNPQATNPAQGFFANWNNKPVAGYRNSDFGDWAPTDHVTLILRELAKRSKISAQEAWGINRPIALSDQHFEHFLPFIRAAVAGEPAGSGLRAAVEILDQWNGLREDNDRDGTFDGPAVTIMQTFMTTLLRQVLSDDIPDPFFSGSQFEDAGYPLPGGRPGTNTTLGSLNVYNALLGENAGIPQKYDLLNGAKPSAVVRTALQQTIDGLTARFGADMRDWLTPALPTTFQTKNFVGVPQATPGETLTNNLMTSRGTENDLIVFRDGKVTACEVAPPGQSGFVAPDGSRSKHYDDQMAMYEDWQCKSVWFTPAEVDAHLESTTTLRY